MSRHARQGERRQGRLLGAVALTLLLAGLLGVTLTTMSGAALATRPDLAGVGATTTTSPTATNPIPVYAYFYQWFTPTSWNRAKKDYPLVGRYSSDDTAVLTHQVQQARKAGINGFLTSWKSTTPLNTRLDRLIRVAHANQLDLGVVYEALDFARNPLPIATVRRDMIYLVDRWGKQLSSSYYGRPIIIWTGTDQFSTADIRSVREALGDRAYLLSAARSVAGYERVADLVDGEAYYWSSADPTSPSTRAKLHAMSSAVHAHQGLWFAPAASAFDGTTLGGTRVIGRRGGQTLVKSLDNAYASNPDAVAVISWNEWSENTYIEPGETYGAEELDALTTYLSARGSGIPPALAEDSSSGGSRSGWSGGRALLLLGGVGVVAVVWLLRQSRTRSRHGGTPRDAHPVAP
jgi:hypothetical protein